MRLPGFFSGEYEASSKLISAQQAINVVPEIFEDRLVFIGVEGTSLVHDFGATIRGTHTAWGVLYVVAGSSLYTVDSVGTVTTLGSVVNDGNPACMTHNIFELLCVSGGSGYTVQKGTTTFAQITDTDFPNASKCDFLDGFGLLLEKDSGRFWYTSIDDFETISGIDFATAEGAPDNNVSMIVDHRELFLFGETTTEVWYNTGDATNPIQRRAFIQRGCTGTYSPAALDNTVFWLGDDMIVYRMDGYTPIRVSNHGIENLISKTTSQPIGYTYSFSGHSYYALNFPGQLTVVYDAATGLWHRRKTREREDCVYHHIASAYGFNYVGGDKLYKMDADLYQHAGDELERIRTIGPLRTGNIYGRIKALTCIFETGENSNSVDPQRVFLEISDDGGKTYGSRMTASVGTQGQYTTEVKFLALGGFYDAQRVLRLSMTDNAKYALVDILVA